MYKILKVTAFTYGEISYRKSTKNLVESLKKDHSGFTIHQITEEQLKEIDDNLKEIFLENPNMEKYKAFSINNYCHPILGFFDRYNEINISDPNSRMKGTLEIKGKEVLYIPWASKFNEERDAFVYHSSPDEFYTTESLESIIKDYLFDGRKCFLDSNSYSTKPPYDRLKDAISPDELYNRIIEQLNKEEDEKGDKVKKLKNFK